MVDKEKPKKTSRRGMVLSVKLRTSMGCLDLMDRSAYFHSRLAPGGRSWHSTAAGSSDAPTCRTHPNTTLDRLGLGVEDLFHHVTRRPPRPLIQARPTPAPSGWSGLASRCPAGRTAIRVGSAAEELAASAARGRELAALLDSETPVPGVTTGTLRPEMASPLQFPQPRTAATWPETTSR